MELYLLIGISVVVFIAIFLIVLFHYKNKLLVLDIKITEAEKEIDVLYESKGQLLYSICERIDEIVEKDLFPDIEKLKDNNPDRFAQSELLSNVENKLLDEMNLRKAFVPDEDIAEMFSLLENISLDCKSTEKYYNDNVVYLNKLLRSFPSNIVGKLKGYESKDEYDYEEEEMFEILKD